MQKLLSLFAALAFGAAWASSPAAPPETAAPSQLTPGTALSVGLGLPYLQARDDVLRPLRWGGPGGSLRLGWQHAGDAVHRVALDVPIAFLQTRYAHEGLALTPRLAYSYLRPVASLGKAGALWVGGQLQGQLALHYFEQWDEEHLYWLTTYDAALHAAWALPLGASHQMSARLSVPLVTLVSRPPATRDNKIDDLKNPGAWLTTSHQGLRPALPPEHLAVQAELAYTRARSAAWHAQAAYDFQFRREREPRPVALLGHHLQLRLLHVF